MRKPLTFAHHFERTSGEKNLELTKKEYEDNFIIKSCCYRVIGCKLW